MIQERPELLSVQHLSKHFDTRHRSDRRATHSMLRAVDDVSFALHAGETLSIVGESGCGKSTLIRTILRLLEPSGGRVLFEGADIANLDIHALRAQRRHMTMVFQDPFGSLNARQRVGRIIEEPLIVHKMGSPKERTHVVAEMLELVGLQSSDISRFPHEFSGGQRQRIGIARALISKPKIVFCDEAVSALDVSIQAQILNLLKDLQEELHVAYVFVAHDLSVVRHISDRVMVMYLGKVVELAAREDLYNAPWHPYTAALLAAAPVPDPDTDRLQRRVLLRGDLPSAVNPPNGCNFHPRCAFSRPGHCDVEGPELTSIGTRAVACHYPLRGQ